MPDIDNISKTDKVGMAKICFHKIHNANLDLISILSMMGMLPVLIFKRWAPC